MPLPLSIPVLLSIMPRARGVVSAFVAPLHQTLARWEISESDARVAAFLAQAAHESAELTRLEENLNYSSPERIAKIFLGDFDGDRDRVPDPEELARAADFVDDPIRLGNFVYANQNGNGDEASGDGWTYRGRGIFQLTGRANYRDASIAIAGDAELLLESPDLVSSPEYACETAGWFWSSRGLNALADLGDFVGITRRINGGTNGLPDRVAYWNRALKALA